MTRYEVLTSGAGGSYAAIVGYRKIEGDEVMDNKLSAVIKQCEKLHIRMMLDEHG